MTYYQSSFLKVLRYIKDKFKSILIENEVELLERLYGLDDNPQRLFIRLFLRRNGWIRQSRLVYEEISIEEAVDALLGQNLVEELVYGSENADVIEIDNEDDTTVPMSLLTNEHLKVIWNGLHLPGKAPSRREDFEKAINSAPLRFYKNQLCTVNGQLKMQRVLIEKASVIRKVTGRVVRLKPDIANLLERLISGLFFMNTSLVEDTVLTMNNAILSDLNRQRYPKYTQSDPLLIFPTRDAWLRFEGALYRERDICEELEVGLRHPHDQWTSSKSYLRLNKRHHETARCFLDATHQVGFIADF